MIKSIKKAVLGLTLGVLAFSCADPDLSPILTFDILGKGGYPRLVSLTSGEYDLNAISTTAFTYEIEFVTIDKGQNVASYEIYASFNGGAEVLYKSYSQSDFTTNADGFRGIAVSIPLTDVSTALGQQTGNLVAGDYIIFNTYVTLTDGNRFGQENSTSAVTGTAFAGFFYNQINITCPLADDKYVGRYTVTYKDPANASNCFTGGLTLRDPIMDMTLGLVSGSTTLRTIAGADGRIPWALNGFNYGGGRITFICDVVDLTSSMGLNGSCGGSINLTSAGPTPLLTTDLSNDSSFELTVNEFSNGECGCPEIEFTLVFTKQ